MCEYTRLILSRGEEEKKDTAVNVIFRFYYDIDDNTGSSRGSTTADINTIVGCNVWSERERERQEKNSEICTYIILNAFYY